MKKKLSLLMAMVMAIACLSLPALAEEVAAEDKPVTEIFIIPAEGEQIELGYINGTPILEVDGLKFKDLNDNGELDVYEDWRADIDERVADLYSQMTLKERSMMLYQVCTCGDNSGVVYNADSLYEQNCPYGESGAYSMWYYINVYGIHTYLDNSNGTPQEQVWAHNEIQAIAEATRLGIPIILTSDRQYNAWGGMIDTPHDAFGTAGNVELAQKLWEQYSKETRALGYHVVFHPYGVELGSWNGEDNFEVYISTNPDDDPARTEYAANDFKLFLIMDGEYWDTAFDRSMVPRENRMRFISKGMDGGENVLEGYEVAAKQTTTGFIYEARIPWTCFSNEQIAVYTPEVGDTVNFNFLITDISYPCPGTEYIPQIAWTGTKEAMDTNPSSWGRLTLAE